MLVNYFKKLSFLVVVLVLASACATTANYRQMLSQWQGAQAQELINSWGYPDSELKLPNGNTVYMYTHRQLYTYNQPAYAPASVTASGMPIFTPGFNDSYASVGRTVSMYCRTWFEINRKNIIVNTQFQGDNCVASKQTKWAP